MVAKRIFGKSLGRKNKEHLSKPLVEEQIEPITQFVDAEPSPLREGGVLLRNDAGAPPLLTPAYVYQSTREDQFLNLSRIDDMTVRRSHKPYIQFSDTRTFPMRHGFLGNSVYQWSDPPFSSHPLIVVPIFDDYNHASNQGKGNHVFGFFSGAILDTSHWHYAASRPQNFGGLRCIYTDHPSGMPQVVAIQHVTMPNYHHYPVAVRMDTTQYIPGPIGTATTGVVLVRTHFPIPITSTQITLYILAQMKVGITYDNNNLSTETFGLKFFVRSASTGSDTGYANQVATYTHSGKPFTSYAYRGDLGSNECTDLIWLGPAKDLYNYGIRWERVASRRDSSNQPINLSNIEIVVGPSWYVIVGAKLEELWTP